MSSLPPIADLDLRRATVCQLLHWMAIGRTNPQALAEAVKPIEKISDVRIFDTGGMLGRGGGEGGKGIGMGEGLAGQLLAYQANKPILDQLLKEAGFEGDNAISSLLGNLENTPKVEPEKKG